MEMRQLCKLEESRQEAEEDRKSKRNSASLREWTRVELNADIAELHLFGIPI